MLSWELHVCQYQYDLIRGEVLLLDDAGLGPVVCLEDAITSSHKTDAAPVDPGEAF